MVNNDPIPDKCKCRGLLEYHSVKDGEECYMCSKCGQTYLRFHDTIGG